MHGMNCKESFARPDCGFLYGLKLGESLTKPIVMSDLSIAMDPCLVMQKPLSRLFKLLQCLPFCRYFWSDCVLSGCQTYCS